MIGVSALFLHMVNPAACAGEEWNAQDRDMLAYFKTQMGAGDGRAWLALGQYYLSEGGQEKAQAALEEAVRSDPQLADAWLRLAYLNMEDSEGYFRKVIEIEPARPEPYYWIAYNFCRQGRPDESVAMFKRYLEVASPDDPDEAGRIPAAQDFIRQMESGVTDYSQIVENQVKGKGE